MKKTARLSAVFLIIAIVFTVIGVVMINKANVNYGDIYDIFEGSIQLDENNVAFTKTEAVDLSKLPDVTTFEGVTYQLNEFNTLEVFGDYCTVVFQPSKSDLMIISIEYPDSADGKVSLQTAIKDGCLYVKNLWSGEPVKEYDEVLLYVNIPEGYKGGYGINGDHASFELCDIDSSMNTKINLYDSKINAKSISADEVTLEMSGTSGSVEAVSSKNGFNLSSVSSDFSVNKADCFYTKLTANSSTLSLSDVVGSLTADTTTTSLIIDCFSVTGNVSVNVSYGRADITVPKDSPISLRHSESYSAFTDNVNWTDGDEKNKDARYVIDTNISFGIVTLSEKE